MPQIGGDLSLESQPQLQQIVYPIQEFVRV